MVATTTVEWQKARRALADAVPKVAELVRGIQRPDAPVLGSWTVIELAAHLTHAPRGLSRLIEGEMESPLAKLSDLQDVTKAWVQEDLERDPQVLAMLIEAGTAHFLETSSHPDVQPARPWLVEGSEVSLVTFTCHLLNEALVHGYDIAKAEGRPWTIEAFPAAMVLLGFIIPVFQTVDGRALVDQEKAAGVKACFDLRLRGHGRMFFMIDDGVCTVEEPSDRKVDCVISADPAAFLLVAWGRQSQWSAIARGKLLAWGRRPWMGLKFRGLFRNP